MNTDQMAKAIIALADENLEQSQKIEKLESEMESLKDLVKLFGNKLIDEGTER